MKTIISFLFLLLITPPFLMAQNPMKMSTAPLTAGANEVSFQSEGETIIATLFLPDDYLPGHRLPTVIVEGPWTQVKEQVGYTYGKALSARGLAVLALDHRYWGESEGSPRSFESTAAKVEDLHNAIDFLAQHPAVQADDINLLGVCAGAGITARVAAEDDRVAGMATVAAWLQHPSTTPLFYGGEKGVQALIAAAEEAQEKQQATGEVTYVKAYDPAEGSGAAMAFPSDYYGKTERGAIPAWKNEFAVAGWKEWLSLNAIDGVANQISIPTLMIHSDQSALPDNVRKFYDLLPGEKELRWGEGGHVDFYDQPTQVNYAADALAEFYFKEVKQK